MPGAAPLRSNGNGGRGWTISATAIRAWQRLLGAAAGTDIDTARRRLTDACEVVRQRYAASPDLEPEPRRGHPHLRAYRGGLPLRLRVVVDTDASEVVDVLSVDGRGSSLERYRRSVEGSADDSAAAKPLAPPAPAQPPPAAPPHQRAPCPWYVSAHAVRQYQTLAGGPPDFHDASDALIEYAAETWRRYLAAPARKPGITRTGAYRYRGPGPLRLQLVVVMEGRAEGDKPQLVDVAPSSEAGRSGSGSGAVERRQLKRQEAQRARTDKT